MSTRLRGVLAEHIERLCALLSDGIARVLPFGRMRRLNTPDDSEFALDDPGRNKRDGYRVSEHRTALTPIRKLWIAWRTQRRAKRSA